MKENDSNETLKRDDLVEKYIWLVRPCWEYKSEKKECTAIAGRFHQYFLYGELLDCSKWSQDAQNCPLCLDKKNNEACKAIIKNEVERRSKRISGSKQNDVWKKRKEPPANWNVKLPQFFIDRNKESHCILEEKIDEYYDYISNNEPDKKYSCTIL